jgi:general secretion pathway protein C
VNVVLYPKALSIALVLVTLVLAALFVAQGTSSLIAAALLRRGAPAFTFGATRAATPAGFAPPDRCAILQRNIFDLASGALCPAKTVASPEPPRPATPPLPGELAPPCAGEARKLIAAVHSERDPEWSFAEVSTRQGKSLLLRQGERVDDQEIVAVYPRAVLFKESSGQYCSLAFIADTARACTAPPCEPPVVSGDPSARGDFESVITAASETEFKVPRAVVDKMLQDQEGLVRSIRVVPHAESGRVVGVKLYGIRNGPWRELGLHNGDLLRAVNGLEIATPEAALEAYVRLRSATQLVVSLERRRRPMTLRYDIE